MTKRERMKKRTKIIIVIVALLIFILAIAMFFSIVTRYILQDVEKIPTTYDEIIEWMDESADDRPFYNTIDEAVAKMTNGNGFKDTEYLDNIVDEVIRFEDEDKLILFYTAVESRKRGSLVVGRFDKRYDEEGQIQYRMRGRAYFEESIGGKMIGSYVEVVENYIFSSLLLSRYSINEDEVFIWGILESENVYTLQIEEQNPTDIVEYEFLGETWYFWYYDDFQSTGDGSTELKVEINE
ncbi:MAG: hypothetical protein ACK5LL_15735 [Suipraeoptans sp.]